MIVVLHFTVPPDDAQFVPRAGSALGALSIRPGYLGGSLGRATDDPTSWVLSTQWRDVGSYRRALGSYDVKLRATPLLATARDVPSAFEELLTAAPGERAVAHASDLDLTGLDPPETDA